MFEIPEDQSAQAGPAAEQYCLHADFVVHCLRRFGVQASSLEDAAQDVFLVAHRRRADFNGRSGIKTWLFGISLRVAKGYRRSLRRDRKYLNDAPATSISETAGSQLDGPWELTARREAVALLHGLLEKWKLRNAHCGSWSSSKR